MIHLSKVIYDRRARDGTWCRLPYPGHPKGCPNFPECPKKYPKFGDLEYLGYFKWKAVIWEFDLAKHAVLMKLRHPSWTERQCRNLLYWQGSIRKKLRYEANMQIESSGDIVLEIPEACGINVFETMALVGIQIDRRPDIVRKIMMIGMIARKE